MGPRLSSCNLSPDTLRQILAEALGSDWIKDKAPTFFPFLWSRGFPSPHTHREGPQSREGDQGRDRHQSAAQKPSSWSPSWLRDAHAYQEGPWVRSNTATSRLTGQRQPGSLPPLSDLSRPSWAQLAVFTPVLLYTYFASSKCFVYFIILVSDFLFFSKEDKD